MQQSIDLSTVKNSKQLLYEMYKEYVDTLSLKLSERAFLLEVAHRCIFTGNKWILIPVKSITFMSTRTMLRTKLSLASFNYIKWEPTAIDGNRAYDRFSLIMPEMLGGRNYKFKWEKLK